MWLCKFLLSFHAIAPLVQGLAILNTSVSAVDSLAPDDISPHCVPAGASSWTPERFIGHDCQMALGQLAQESTIYGNSMAIFKYNNGHSIAFFTKSRQAPLNIPRRYSHGQCVLAIVMMRIFGTDWPRYAFPEMEQQRPPNWPTTARTFWPAISEEAHELNLRCHNGCGYSFLSGPATGIGIVAWGLNSQWDRYIRRVMAYGNTEFMSVAATNTTETY